MTTTRIGTTIFQHDSNGQATDITAEYWAAQRGETVQPPKETKAPQRKNIIDVTSSKK